MTVATNASFVGNWYGIGEPDDPDIFYIDSYHADGTFNSEYRKCEKGKLIYSQTQSGRWSVADGVEHVTAEMINGTPAKVEDTYKVELLTDSERRIRLDPQGYVFVGHRVASFDFPACPNDVRFLRIFPLKYRFKDYSSWN